MKSYEELLEQHSELDRGNFCVKAVKEFMGSQEYADALVANRYYTKHNVTIENFEKWVYTVTGRKVRDIYSANYKLKASAFRRMVIQQANYLLGKGIQLDSNDKKKKLGKKFDLQLIKAAKWAMVEGRSFGFWNGDHMDVFGYCMTDTHPGFCPLYSDEDGELKAGISFRMKVVGNKHVDTYTLFEPEGTTKYIKKGTDDIAPDGARKPYKTRTVSTKAEGVIDVVGENYNGILPIVPLYASDTYESELVGMRENIDCYDLVKSGLANNVDDASEIYWIVQNAGGMDDVDLAQFLQRLKRTKAADVDSQSGGSAEAHTLDVPTDARKTLLEILRTDMYDDMMLLDRRTMSAAQKTNQELEMAYQPQDDKTNDFEFFVMDFCEGIMALAGIESEIRFERNKVVNNNELTQMVLSSATYLSPECVIRHLPFLSPEEKEEEIRLLAERDIEQFSGSDGDDDEDEKEEQNEEE